MTARRLALYRQPPGPAACDDAGAGVGGVCRSRSKPELSRLPAGLLGAATFGVATCVELASSVQDFVETRLGRKHGNSYARPSSQGRKSKNHTQRTNVMSRQLFAYQPAGWTRGAVRIPACGEPRRSKRLPG